MKKTHLKWTLQREMCNAYRKYIKNIWSASRRTRWQPKNLFTYIKRIKKNDNTGIVARRKDGKLTDNATEKANIPNSQFQKAFSEETTSESIPVKGKSNSKNGRHHYFKSRCQKITGQDQLRQRNWLRSNLWKTTERALLWHLYCTTYIFQKSLDTRKIPEHWNHANVCPVFKKVINTM